MTIELTGYSFQDNQGGNNARICCPVLHRSAGGKGTFEDPITVAVPGHGGKGMETPVATRFYLPTVRRYVIVEDSGASKMGTRHLDMYVGGEGLPRRASDRCMDQITGRVPAVMNPGPGLPVTVGPLTGSAGCRI